MFTDVERVQGEREQSGPIHPRGAEAAGEAQGRADAAHARPGQRTLEQDGREPGEARAVCVGLRLTEWVYTHPS
jgi:hypothetical protein